MMKRNLMLGAATVLMLAATSPASAADLDANAKGIINFEALDKDRDGTLTETEFNSNTMFKGNRFGDVDKNDDGVVSGEELSTWARVHGKGNAVGTSNSVGTRGTIGLPPITRNVDIDAKVGADVNTGTGIGIGVGGKASGSTDNSNR